MVAPLTSPTNVSAVLGVNPNDPSQQPLLSLYIAQASQACADWCNRADFALAPYTRMLSGNSGPALSAPEWPVQGLTLAGNLTQGSAVISGLPTGLVPNATNLFVNQSVLGAGVPQGAYLTSVASASSGSVTMSANATANATAVPLTFGTAVFLDDNALAGSAFNAFPPGILSAGGSMLQEGIDYYWDWDSGPGGPCSSGLLYRAGFFWPRPSARVWGLVGSQSGPRTKNVKVQYLSGYLTIPPSVESACLNLIAAMRQSRKWGQGVSGLSAADLSVTLAGPDKVDTGLFTAVVRGLLAPYVITPVVSD